MTDDARFWAVIPAAGTGTRMQKETPKQYLTLNGRRVIEYSLEVFCAHAQIAGVVVALAAEDKVWRSLAWAQHSRVRIAPGGKERCHSVLNCLHALAPQTGSDDWVLVHDAARPCISGEDIDQMIAALRDHPVGGLLALPVRDTMKRVDAEGNVQITVDRQGLWHALTPQMFRIRPLTRALEKAIAEGKVVTDESQAMEFSGYRPGLVEGRAENIKITRPGDLKLAEWYLSESRGRSS